MLKGLTAIVTGSTSGIGLGIARALAAEGVNVMLNGFGDKAAIETLRADLAKEFGVQVLYNDADLSKAAACEDLVTDTEKRFGKIDILVNNAGIQHVARVENFPVDRWDAVISINLSSAFHTSRKALPGMQARGFGRIINIASTHGLVASTGKAAYVAAKHGIVGLTKVIALENAESPITCNAICPGWVLTTLVQAQIETRAKNEGIAVAQAERELLIEKQPTARFTTVEQLGAVAVFLAGPGAANITGISLPVDGGWLAR
jgi:3-hydroxybutyrate dehydrogenase